MTITTPQELFLHELQDAYSAEQQILKALPKVIEQTEDEELKESLAAHLAETKAQVNRLDKLFETLNEKPSGETCMGMQGIIAEGEKGLKEVAPALRDLAITGSAARIEYYEQVAYSNLIAMAQALDYSDEAMYLQETLDEEVEAGKNVMEAAERLLEAIDMQMPQS